MLLFTIPGIDSLPLPPSKVASIMRSPSSQAAEKVPTVATCSRKDCPRV